LGTVGPLTGIPGFGSTVIGAKTTPDRAIYEKLASIIVNWNKAADADYKWDKICDFKEAWAGDELTATANNVKDQVLCFSDERSTDGYAEVLSPKYGGPLPLLMPTPKKYPSPVHYVEAMKMISAATPGALMAGGIDVSAITGQPVVDSCDIARLQSDTYLQQPYSSVMQSLSKPCDPKAIKQGFFDTTTILCKFWISLWIGLWAKYQLYPKYAGALVNTGSKLLIYLPADQDAMMVYGMKSDSTMLKGCNAAGLMLMMIRKYAKAGVLTNRLAAPTAIYDKFMRPILEEIYGIDATNTTQPVTVK
jgi:hypothetical protein